MPRFSQRTLIVVMLLGGPMLAGAWWTTCAMWSARIYWSDLFARALITGTFGWIGFGLLGWYLFIRWVRHLRVF